MSFMHKKPKPVPSLVSAPPLVQASSSLEIGSPSSQTLDQRPATSGPSYSQADDAPATALTILSPAHIVSRLRAAVHRIPESVPEAVEGDPLSGFARDPTTVFDPKTKSADLWEEFLNSFMKSNLGWDNSIPAAHLVRRGDLGLAALMRFVEYFVLEQGVDWELFDGKLNHLMEEVDRILNEAGLPPTSTPIEIEPASIAVSPPRIKAATSTISRVDDSSAEQGARTLYQPIDVDALEQDTVRNPSQKRRKRCIGYIFDVPVGQTPSKLYPFALHDKINIPWDYSLIDGVLRLHARSCEDVITGRECCGACQDLRQNTTLQGIQRRAIEGVHENANHAYHGFGALVEILQRKNSQIEVLRLRGLNNARRLIGQAASLSDHKRFVVAIASGKYERVDRLVRVALGQKRGIRGIIRLYHSAAMGIYQPKSYTEEDDMRGLLLWKMGGNRIAQIAHRALGLPGITTLRNRSTMPPIIPSHGTPTTFEIQKNIDACFKSIHEVLQGAKVVHQILMLDELATEKRLRWDHLTNRFLGLCREHAKNVSLEFNTEDDLEEVFQTLADGDVHYAAEATIGALGLLSKDTRLYAARPILISGDCKRETGQEHATLIRTILEAVDSKKSSTHLRVVSVASDGETRRGTAFVHLTFKQKLPTTSNIYPLLSPLRFMDFYVGDDDLTCDKDWKHVFKRFRNLLLRDRGVVINGMRITPSIIRAHLQSSGLTSVHINSVFNPEDKQDVKLAFDMLKDIWSLPPAHDDLRPGFSNARQALRTLGKLLHHVLFPYLCVDLSLSEQLEHLSAAAHLLLVLYRKSGKDFIPTLLYTDLMIMIKNAFFCVAKAKVDDPEGSFWLILLGTDRLEELFGILRTMIGNDANLDMYQLVCRLSGTTEVSNILSKYPHWDRAPRRLKLPAITRDSQELPDKSDHIKPASWRGNVAVKNVTLITCWRRGRRMVEDEYTFAKEELLYLEANSAIDILSPTGALIIDLPLAPDDNEDEDETIVPTNSHPPASDSDGLVIRTTDIDDAVADDNAVTGDVTADPEDLDAHLDAAVPTASSSSPGPTTPAPQVRSFENFVIIGGKKLSKSRALALRSKYSKTTSSTDRLKRVQEVERYGPRFTTGQDVSQYDSAFGGPCLLLQEPIASLIRCEKKLFLCLGEVNDIKVDGQSFEHVGLDILVEDTVRISYQVIGLVPATSADDASLDHDWRSCLMNRERTFSVPGRLIQPINPAVSAHIGNKIFYLFKSGVLVALAASLFEQLALKHVKAIPTVSASRELPYREASGEACFVCESDDNLGEVEDGESIMCPKCPPTVFLDSTSPQRVLAHLGAHILHDKTHVNRSDLPCGLCLRPYPMCRFFVKKGKGAKASLKINRDASTGCTNMLTFSYKSAENSTASSPCSNVPLLCPLCPKTEPAVWRYNLQHHFSVVHPSAERSKYQGLWKLTRFEEQEMNKIWLARRKYGVASKRTKKGKEPALVVSQAHSSRIALIVPTENEIANSQTSDSSEEEPDIGRENDSDDDLPELAVTSLAATRSPSTEGHDEDLSSRIAAESPEPTPTANSAPATSPRSMSAGVSVSAEAGRPNTRVELDPAPTENAHEAGLPPRRKRKVRDVGDLSQCLCGETVSAEQRAGGAAVECRREACETKWYHLACTMLEIMPRSYICEACEYSGPARGGKRRG
ncbi:hypothetical protein FPV67DRAFT_686987 [Lyophyllum atratum]|nr:hypothetical protein FPV67DRAFT_686987 [Lyophyllum atratum]